MSRKGIAIGVVSAIALAAVAGAYFWRSSTRSQAMPPKADAKAVPESATVPIVGTTASTGFTEWKSWPPKEVVVGPPAGWPHKTSAREPQNPPASPSPAKDAFRKPGEYDPSPVRSQLLDPKLSSAAKLALVEKLKSRPAEESVPVLLAVLEDAKSTDAVIKPTVVRALAELKHPLADEALSRLSYASEDETVRLTIASLRAKERSK